MYLHYGLKQNFLICKLWIHTVHWFLHIFVFILKICSLCSTLVKNWTNPYDPRSLVSLHIFLSELSAFLLCTFEIQEIRRLKLSQKLKSVFNLSLFENFRNNLSPHVFTIFLKFFLFSEGARSLSENWKLKFSVGSNWELSFSLILSYSAESKVAWFLLQNIRINWFGVRLEVLYWKVAYLLNIW